MTQTEEVPALSTPGDVAKRSLGAAIATALILIALVIIAVIVGKTAFFFLALVAVLLALWELLDGLERAGRRPATIPAILGGGAMMTLGFLERYEFIPIALVATVLVAIFFSLLPGRRATPATDVAWTMLGVFWITGGGAAAAALLTLSSDGVLLLLSLVIIAALDDIGAYLVGTNIGRHKIAPSISPGKSWEGVIGGSLFAFGGGVLVGAIMWDLSLIDGIALGAIAALFNPIGDLFESMAKREIGIKDSSGLLPGHGGFLDRLDAIIMCAPPFFIYLRLFVY